MFHVVWPLLSAGIAAMIARKGYKKKSLSRDGAVLAWFVGTVTFLASFRFGVILIAFFLSSSKLTKYGQERKKKIEAEFREGGQRNWVQVVCNGLAGTLIALVWLARFGLQYSWTDPFRTPGHSSLPSTSSPSSSWLEPSANVLVVGFLAHYACCCGDTWASELGSLARHLPRLILPPFAPVPTGTNGGVSFPGLAASLAGGGTMGLVAATTGVLAALTSLSSSPPWTVESAFELCRSNFALVGIGLATGLLGSLLDSVMGATLQYSGLDHASNKVVSHPPQLRPVASASASPRAPAPAVDVPVGKSAASPTADREGHTWICGSDLLSNEAVNLWSSLLTSLVAMAAATAYGL